MRHRGKIFLVAFLACLCTNADSFNHPCILINKAEITAVKGRIGSEPWKSAYGKMIATANKGLTLGPWFRGDRIINTADNAQRMEAYTMGYYLVNMALAWNMTGDARYIKRVEYILNDFCVDPATRMSTNAGKGLIGWNNSFMPAVYGTDLALNGLTTQVRSGVVSWFRSFLASTLSHEEFGGVGGNHNRADWWVAMVMASSIVVDDSKGISMGVEHWRKRSFKSTGQLNGVGGATGGDVAKEMSYNFFAMNALSDIVEMARHHGYALYSEGGSGGKSRFLKMLDFYTGWAFENEKTGGGNVAIYELGYLADANQSYLSIVQRLGRPISLLGNFSDMHCSFGPITLTHARGAYPYTATGGTATVLVTTTPSQVVKSAKKSYSQRNLSRGSLIVYDGNRRFTLLGSHCTIRK